MGAKQSTGNSPRGRVDYSIPREDYSSSGPSHSGAGPHVVISNPHSVSNSRARARSLGNFAQDPSTGLHIPVNNGGAAGGSGTPDSDSSTPEDTGPVSQMAVGLHNFTRSLPVHLFALHGIKCPVCSKFIPPEEIECHLVVCLTKPRITYNEDILTEDKGECVICLDDLEQGDTIARLPCLCIYHKGCIDKWFEKNRSCPEHPQD